MTEALIQNLTAPKQGYRQIFEKIRKELPQRSDFNFNSATNAKLRRLDPETEFATPALVRVLVASGVETNDFRNNEKARAWAAVAQAHALMAHADLRNGPHIGAVLYYIKFSDNRLARLLTARSAALREQATRTVRFIVSSGESASLDDLLELMLVENLPRSDEWAESLRLKIVENFERTKSKEDTSEN